MPANRPLGALGTRASKPLISNLQCVKLTNRPARSLGIEGEVLLQGHFVTERHCHYCQFMTESRHGPGSRKKAVPRRQAPPPAARAWPHPDPDGRGPGGLA